MIETSPPLYPITPTINKQNKAYSKDSYVTWSEM